MRLDRTIPQLFLLLAVLALAQPAQADEPITVGDGTAASCTETALANALAIAGAVGGGTINFQCGAASISIPVTATFVIPDNTTINGGGTIALVGGANVIVAFVSGNTTVVLNDLVISGRFCSFGSCNGGVHNEGTLTVNNTTFSDIHVNVTGALTNLGTVTVNYSVFLRNRGFLVAGGILNHGTLTVNNSTFSDNDSDGGFGGAIANFGTATVHNSTFSDSLVLLGPGGAIVNVGTLAVKNCRFSVSHGVGVGGGISSSGTLTIENSTFSPDNNAFNFGGGLAITDGFASVRNSVFSRNHAEEGGGIANFATLELIDSTVSGNNAIHTIPGLLGQGGGIFNAGTLSVVNSRVFGNGAADRGGGIFNLGTLILNNSIITNNTAGVGGGIYNCLVGEVSGGSPNIPCHGRLILNDTIVTENAPDNIFP